MRVIILFFFLLIVLKISSQTTCQSAIPFCANPGYYNYTASTNNGAAPTGPSYGCLGSQPNPAWFYLEVTSTGSLGIQMSANQDIDFICWGPFTNLSSMCNNLNASMIVPNSGGNNGCSFSGSATETLSIANVQAGQFYMLMVTNFSNSNQSISLTNLSSTNVLSCSSVSLTGNQQICFGETINLNFVTSNLSNISSTIVPGSITFIGSVYSFTPVASGNYSVITSGLNTINNTYTTLNTFIVNPTPTLSLGANSPSICLGDSLVIYYGGAPNIFWTDGIITGGFGVTVTPSVSTTYTFVGINSYSCQSSVTAFSVDVYNCFTSLTKNINSNDLVSFYPNPTQNELIIFSDHKMHSINVFDKIGNLVKVFILTGLSNKEQIEIGFLTDGIYFLEVNLQSGFKTTKKLIRL